MGFQPSSPLISTSCHLGSPAPATHLINTTALHGHSVAMSLLRACDIPETPHAIHFANSEQNFRLCPTSQVAREAQSANSYNHQPYNVAGFLLFEHDWKLLSSRSATLTWNKLWKSCFCNTGKNPIYKNLFVKTEEVKRAEKFDKHPFLSIYWSSWLGSHRFMKELIINTALN